MDKNSIIDAHQEYIERQFIPMAPGLPMSSRTTKEEKELYDAINREHYSERSTELLDEKMKNEVH